MDKLKHYGLLGENCKLIYSTYDTLPVGKSDGIFSIETLEDGWFAMGNIQLIHIYEFETRELAQNWFNEK